MVKFKTGDKVRIINDDTRGLTGFAKGWDIPGSFAGTIGYVREPEVSDRYRVYPTVEQAKADDMGGISDSDGYFGAHKESDLELIKEDKVRKLKTGDRVTCKISGIEIKDAKVYVKRDGTIYICQDKKDGSDSPDKLGYKYSWIVTGGDINDITSFNGQDDVSELRFAERTVADSQVGDVLLCGGDEVTVVFNDGEHLVTVDTYDDSWDSATYSSNTSSLSVPEEKDTAKELTMDEIAEKFGVNVKDLKIKKD